MTTRNEVPSLDNPTDVFVFPFYYQRHENNYHIYLGSHLFLPIILHGTPTTKGIICVRRCFFSANVFFNNKEQIMSFNLWCQKEKCNLSSSGKTWGGWCFRKPSEVNPRESPWGKSSFILYKEKKEKTRSKKLEKKRWSHKADTGTQFASICLHLNSTEKVTDHTHLYDTCDFDSFVSLCVPSPVCLFRRISPNIGVTMDETLLSEDIG